MIERGVKSAERVLDLLELFASAPEPLGVSAIAKRLGFPKSSVHMLLLTLEQRGFVVGDDERRFRLHPSFSPEARAWIGSSRGRLVQLAAAPMQAVVDQVNETCLLTVLRPDWLTEYIAKISSTHELRLDPPVGLTREPNAGSSGIVLLAHLEPEELDRFFAAHPLHAYTARTPQSPRALREQLRAVREAGYAITEGTNYPHASGLAAPVRNAHGKVVAAVSIGAPTTRFAIIRAAAIRAVCEAAAAVSAKLGR